MQVVVVAGDTQLVDLAVQVVQAVVVQAVVEVLRPAAEVLLIPEVVAVEIQAAVRAVVVRAAPV
jgi:hypothetical protein